MPDEVPQSFDKKILGLDPPHWDIQTVRYCKRKLMVLRCQMRFGNIGRGVRGLDSPPLGKPKDVTTTKTMLLRCQIRSDDFAANGFAA